MITHQVLDPFRQRAAVEDLIELGARFLLLVLSDEQAQAMPSQRVIGRRACLDPSGSVQRFEQSRPDYSRCGPISKFLSRYAPSG